MCGQLPRSLPPGRWNWQPRAMAPPTTTVYDQLAISILDSQPGWPFLSGDIGLGGLSPSRTRFIFGQGSPHPHRPDPGLSAPTRGRAASARMLTSSELSLSAGIYGDGVVKKANLTVDNVHRGWGGLLPGPGRSERIRSMLRAGGRYYNTFNRLGTDQQ